MTEVKIEKGWRQFIRLVQHTNPSKLLLGIALLLSVGTTIVGLLVPLFTKNLINDFSISSLSTGRIILLVTALLLQAVASGISIYLLNHLGQSVVAGIRDSLWKKLLVLPVPFYDENQTGETVSRMTNDTAVVKGLITDHLANFLSGTISIIGSIVVLLLLDWKMALLMFIALPLAAVILMTLGRKMHQVSKGMQTETARFTSVLQQVLSEIRLVKASNAEAIEYKNGKNGITQLFQYGLKEAKIQALITPLIGLVIMVLLVVILGYGGMRVSSGALMAGDLVAFIMYLFQIVMPMGQLAAFFTQFQKATGATERIIAIMDMNEEEDHSNQDVHNVNQSITVEDLNYSYKNGEDVLMNISFSAEAGKVTAIVGPSGSGKTTLFSLLERYYQPQQGAIRLGQEPINQFSLYSWRSQIGYVSQESPIVVGTIRDNICYGMDKKIEQADIERVAKMAYADQFIAELPNGYDTEVGERGIKLSGGQRQRIAIARAFLRDPKILMLDEATSSLDSKSERVVQQALQNLMKGRTTLVIAHRLSTVIDSDQIIFLDKGKITGSGTHEQLLRTHSLYREFAEQQLRINEPA
ncbi:ABC transporter ATP-binding protein [Bacillus sp. ISL-40]|uniref:ABC transporter ATP-binding protein n=1 Tax=unclassified Bacillus (in: firmicutes) TaxID=185979 RepID=UPI001BE79CD0|nr:MULTISPECIES: ABC transporter ATP-binding protein [unclassified Bacillus (in: firmicutes)]MBT2699610.1 ABC transporter ATP-binding protein [Bacillus sp. ISL-40]MBT2724162.1 ABC transporter ATP-binding protein [Bacillus sp. ISL-46]MBT2741108.1 ABC transporter ATP-binding protein [Bacillus sp. ISL-77]